MTKQYKKSDQVPGMIVTSEGIALSQDRVVDLLNQLPAREALIQHLEEQVKKLWDMLPYDQKIKWNQQNRPKSGQ